MKIGKFLSRFFRKKVDPPKQLEYKSIMKSFDIEVTDYDGDNMTPITHVESGVSASSAKELVSLYKMCGQDIHIIREYEKSPAPAPTSASVKTTVQTQPDSKLEIKPNTNVVPDTLPHATTTELKQKHFVAPSVKQPPKLFTIAGVECKLDNGKIYQKQWVKLLGTEASQYRLISDTNNKEFSMAGKHLEVLKWVLIEDEQAPIDNAISQIING